MRYSFPTLLAMYFHRLTDARSSHPGQRVTSMSLYESQQPNDVKTFDQPQYLPIYISQIYKIEKGMIQPPTMVWAFEDRSSLFKICILGAESMELTFRAFSIVIDRF